MKWSQRLYYSSPAPARGRAAGFARELRLGALLGEGRGLLAAQVLYAQLEHAEGAPLAVYGGGAVRLAVVRGVLEGQALYGAALGRLVRDFAHLAEGDDAAEVGRVVLRHYVAAVYDAEGRARAGHDGVVLVPGAGAVEIYRAALIDVIERYGVGIAPVAEHGQHAVAPALEYGEALRLGQGLTAPAQFSEHITPPQISGSGTSTPSRTRPKLHMGAPSAAGRRISSALRRRLTAKR